MQREVAGSCRVSVRDGRQELQQLFRDCRGELQGFLYRGQKGDAEALSGRVERNCVGFFRMCRGEMQGSVREGRKELQWLFRECRGKELLMFRQEGQKEVVGAFFREGRGWRDSVRAGGQKKELQGLLLGVLSLEAKPTRITTRILRSYVSYDVS